MSPYVLAETPALLHERLEQDCACWPQLSEKERDARELIGHFLRAIGSGDRLHFPLSVTHTPDEDPNFRIAMEDQSIGVEVTSNAAHRSDEWNETDDEERNWVNCTDKEIERTTAVRCGNEFRNADSNWLVVHDELSSFAPLIRPRWEGLCRRLVDYWERPSRFDLIALASEDFEHFLIVTSWGATLR